MTNEEILKTLKSGLCDIRYNKKDGSLKETQGTLNEEYLAELALQRPASPQSIHHANTHVTYYDTDSEGFRTFLFENVLSCQAT